MAQTGTERKCLHGNELTREKQNLLKYFHLARCLAFPGVHQNNQSTNADVAQRLPLREGDYDAADSNAKVTVVC